MMRTTSTPRSGLGGPGLWDPMPLVPPTAPPSEPEDAQLIWSKPPSPKSVKPDAVAGRRRKAASRKTAKKATKRATKKPAKKPAKKAAKKRAKKAAKRRPAKKARAAKKAGRSKKRR